MCTNKIKSRSICSSHKSMIQSQKVNNNEPFCFVHNESRYLIQNVSPCRYYILIITRIKYILLFTKHVRFDVWF